ncbi:MAG TPA: FHA domain-containing protein [Syntrophobacteria bacterium]|nr:FHA domain-containing protein [Syntrophobacteria bacterium]
MKRPPTIIVQLVHIQGPLKGQIQEFSEPEIVIGRKPSCHLRFPVDLTIVSREHATILREGNRFRVVDKSANGTFVNGKRIKEAYLRDGDVMSFAEGGPKVSFLTQMREAPLAPPQPEQVPPLRPEPQFPPEPEPGGTAEHDVPPPPPPPQPSGPKEVIVQAAQAPLVIQYGPTLKSFKEVPVTVGKSLRSGFVLDHPQIFDEHLVIFFHNNQYWVKDLTGKDLVQVNRRPISSQAPLAAQDELALSPKGPVFRFLGAGRFAEVEAAKPEEPPQAAAVTEKRPAEEKADKGAKSLFKKFLRS